MMTLKDKIKQFAIWFLGLAILVGLDQVVKLLTIRYLKGTPGVVVIPGVFQLTYVENRGAAFGVLQNQRWLFLILTALVVIALIFVYIKLPQIKQFRLTRFCCLVVTAGAIGNWIDRIFRHFVVDMFYFSLIDFPVFNVADCYVVVCGIGFCILALFQKDLLEDIMKQLKTPRRSSGE